MVDEFIEARAGGDSAFLAAVGQDPRAVAVVAAHIASYLPVVGLLGELALGALGEKEWDAALIGAAIGLIPGGKLAGKLGKLLGGISKHAWGAAKQYAARGGALLARQDGLIGRAGRWLAQGCGCFEAATEVWSERGLIPIAQVCEGDRVFAQNEETGEVSLRSVIRTFVRKGAPIVAVTLMSAGSVAAVEPWAAADAGAHGLSAITVLNTTEEHPFFAEGKGWVRADNLDPGAAIRTVTGDSALVMSVVFTGRLSTVYNFEVEGLHTYHVGNDGMLVRNGGPCKLRSEWSVPNSALKARPAARGDPPIGMENKPVELHHPDPRDPLRVQEMSRSSHRGKGNKGPNHPSPWKGMTPADRAAYNAERTLYWEEQWDTGRFNSLPR